MCYQGLRVLSLKVKEIVCEKKETTYKEVAEALVQDLNLKDIEMVFIEELLKFIKGFLGERWTKCEEKGIWCFKCIDCCWCFEEKRETCC